MGSRDIYYQISTNQARLQDATNTPNNWTTGISSNYRTYDPSSSRFSSVATTRASLVDPQRGFANFYGLGRYGNYTHYLANSSQVAAATANRISYLAPSASRPNAYYWGQEFSYVDPIKEVFSNQTNTGLSFYRLSNGNNVIFDQYKNTDPHWLFYNNSSLDSNLLTLSSAGAISKIEAATVYQDNTTNPSTPLLFQTHSGMPADGATTWRTDYPRDSYFVADNRDTYIWYRPNFGSNINIPANVELEGEWVSNYLGGRSGS